MNRHIAPPDFAMSFTPEAVLLEHRDGLGWRPLGQAPFAGREMTARLAALRNEAGAVTGQADTILVIPDDQILYTTLTVPVGTDTPKAIARALEAMTPYQAADLAFDWCPSVHGDIETLRVAAVARRTLEEAEDFARSQGFRPAGFVARPEDDRFDGQPDFGPSRMAGDGFTRPPFSQPDLAQARVTDPAVAVPEPASDRVDAPLVISRIVPHVVADAAPAQVEPAPEPAAAPAAAVIRHKDVKAPAAPRILPPRAQAVHDRAREARAHPAPASQDAAQAPSLAARLRRLDPGRLPVLMGVLVVGLVLVLAFFGAPSDDGVAPTPVTTAEAPALPADPVTQPAPTDTAEAAEEAAPVAPTAEAVAEAPAAEAVVSAPVAEPEQVQTETQPAETAAAPAAAPTSPAAVTETTQATEITEPTDAAPETAAVQAGPATPAVTATRPQPAPVQPAATPAPQPEDALTQALTQAMTTPQAAAPQAPVSALTMEDAPAPVSAQAARSTPAAAPPAASPVPSAPATPAARVETPTQRLASSARPPRVAPVRATPPARTDARPTVPANPQPFAERARPDAAGLTGSRPPERPATQPAVTPASAPARATPPAASSNRPPARPERQSMIEEGSRAEDGQPTRLTQAEERALTDLLRDLRTAQAGATGLSTAERGALIRLADARPTRKPVAVGGPSQRAVQDAVAAAVAEAPRTRSASGTGLGRSARPLARPGGARTVARGDPGPGSASLSGRAIDQAVAEAVSENSPLPGAVALTALRSSALPPRRAAGAAAAGAAAAGGGAAAVAAAVAAAPLAPSVEDLRAAAQAQSEEAALAEQRRLDAELQAQAEARARARAAQDAQAEAQARAAAEARARAQAEAEARAAAARQQRYAPPEAEDEPEVAASIPDGRTPTTAGVAATVKDGIQINRTQIIGTIGAGKASRALVRLSNGRVLTLRLGDRINGGTITDIGDSRITFVKGGQQQALSVLGGR
ncbi:hypothetical protein RAH32_06270 [Paracoccus sp. WLY502]|uniref:hypothetical protein n=1 Tax=Paracoccus yibinensis TaxID=3068891 RepID=UPI002796472A|nr:hypothetical protein [Paracoccus sp. WLY502]MDQ1900046.1 hypothetical protein [Paracoccus sp. WLY502]